MRITTDQVPIGSEAYIILPTQYDENGYIPSKITAYEYGHSPLTGKDELSTPWYWGKTLEEATAVCNEQNRKVYGITPDQADLIMITAMGGYS